MAQIAGLRLPFVAMQLLPFAVLLGGLLAFWRLSRSSELVVARAAGVSAWGFLSGPVAVALLLRAARHASSFRRSPPSMLARAERLDHAYLRNTSGLTALAGGRLWLRQADRGLEPDGLAILSGRPVSERRPAAAASGFAMTDVSLWRLSANDRPLARIEAPRARLLPGQWVLEDAVAFNADRSAAPRQALLFPTELTPVRIENSFASPDTLSFWALPGFIAVLEAAGFSAVRHRLHFQSLLVAAGARRLHGAAGGRLLHALVAPRRGGADARRRHRGRLRAVRARPDHRRVRRGRDAARRCSPPGRRPSPGCCSPWPCCCI